MSKYSICENYQADLIMDIELHMDSLQRCCEIYDRLVTMPSNAVVDAEVVGFIKEYTGISMESVTVGFDNPIMNVLRAIKDGIVYLIKKLWELFRWIFDAHYRARKEFIDIRTRMMTKTDDTFSQKFSSYMCESVVDVKDIEMYILKENTLIDVLTSVAGVTDLKHADALISTFKKDASIEVVDGNKFTDSLSVPKFLHSITLSRAGWTLDNFIEIIGKYITVLSKIETLKATEARLRKDSNELLKEVQEAMDKNVSADAVKDLQLRAALRIRLSRMIVGGLTVLTQRGNSIANVIRTIAKETLKNID